MVPAISKQTEQSNVKASEADWPYLRHAELSTQGREHENESRIRNHRFCCRNLHLGGNRQIGERNHPKRRYKARLDLANRRNKSNIARGNRGGEFKAGRECGRDVHRQERQTDRLERSSGAMKNCARCGKLNRASAAKLSVPFGSCLQAETNDQSYIGSLPSCIGIRARQTRVDPA